jgi:cell division protease FtsH
MATTPSGGQGTSGRRPPRSGQQERTPARGQHHGWRVEPAPDGRGAPPPPRQGFMSQRTLRVILVVVALLALNAYIVSTIPDKHHRIDIPYFPTFIQQVEKGNVVSITYSGDAIQGTFKQPVKYPEASTKATASRLFATRQPGPPGDPELVPLLKKENVTFSFQPPEQGRGLLATLLLSFAPTLLLIGLFVLLLRRASASAAGGIGGFGRSRARRYELNEGRVTFEDVAGIDEAKAELSEIVDFLRNPDKYRKLGGKIPRGVLLSGLPGTGKTLLARAVAGEAGVPFFSMSASEFIEMIVGVGASRVRDLFAQAKAAAPAIIFIDELDAIGRSRSHGGGGLGGHDEREQTLNQILTEMDGFDPTAGVIVLAATNRPDVLDAALLRPGRFDRRVAVQPPDRRGRERILQVHTRSVPLAKDVDLATIASSTPGMVGADLANLVNEAALLAARRNHARVEASDFSDSLEKIVLGAERKIVLGPADRRRTAYHEAGHALVGMLTPGADPVRKVSIIPRGMALGVTFSAPAMDRFNYDREYLLGRIKVALGGRVAEELVFGDLTTGAESDIQQLTQIARQMVGRWGMSDAIGPVAVLPSEGQNPLLPGAAETSQDTQQRVDAEVRRIVESCYAETTRLLGENRDRLDALTAALLAAETLDEADAYRAAGVEPPSHDEDDERAGEVIAPGVETGP